jgi:hypothetical protein
VEPLENTFNERPFGKLILSGINALTVAFASSMLEKGISASTWISRLHVGNF